MNQGEFTEFSTNATFDVLCQLARDLNSRLECEAYYIDIAQGAQCIRLVPGGISVIIGWGNPSESHGSMGVIYARPKAGGGLRLRVQPDDAGLWDGLLDAMHHDGWLDERPAETNADEAHSLQRQLADARENLRLIEEHKAQYVREVDIPLQDTKNELRLREQITKIEKKLGVSGSSEEYT